MIIYAGSLEQKNKIFYVDATRTHSARNVEEAANANEGRKLFVQQHITPGQKDNIRGTDEDVQLVGNEKFIAFVTEVNNCTLQTGKKIQRTTKSSRKVFTYGPSLSRPH